MRPLLALLLLVSAAFAGDAIDDALADLGSDDGAKRDAAEKSLWAADGSAWERAKTVLAATKDPEVRVRLTPIVDWLAVQAKSSGLADAWKDRWFLVSESGAVVGVEHDQAVLESDGGIRTWKFTNEADAFDRGPEPEHLRLVCHVRHDPALTPVDAEVESRSDLGLTHMKFSWKDGIFRIETLALVGPMSGVEWPRTSSMPLEVDPGESFTIDALVAEFIERASLARIDSVRFMTHSFFSLARSAVVPYEARLVDVAHLDIRGKSVEARHYLHESSESGSRAEFWISDHEGLVKCVIDRMEMVLVDEATARAQGFDPASRRAKAAKERVEALTSAADAAARDRAELAVLSMPAALSVAREALAKTSDPDLKERLERCVRWLDPEFAKADLTRLWADRYFQFESGGVPVGAERMSASPAADSTLDWTGEGSIRMGASLLSSEWTARTRFDSFLSPLSADFHFAEKNEPSVHWRAVWGEGGPEIKLLEGVKRSRGDRQGRRGGASEEALLPPTIEPCLSALVERASLARLRAAVFLSHGVQPEDLMAPRRYAIEFAGEEKIESGGRTLAVRRYVHAGLASDRPEEYWVSDTEGLVRMTYQSCVVTAITRDAWLAAGFDSASLQATANRKRLEAVRGADETARADAMAELESDPAALPALREALASEKDAAVRARLKSLCDWLDPAFAHDATLALGKERWFGWKKNGVADGWVRFSGAPAGDGWEWKVAQNITGSQIFMEFDGTFRAATPGLCHHVDLQFHGQGSGMDVEAKAFVDGATVTLTEAREAGQDVPLEGNESQTLDGGSGRPVAVGVLVPRFLERASLARLESLDLDTWDMPESEQIRRSRYVFRGEEKITSSGHEITARRYGLEGAEKGSEVEFWITDDGGVVKAKRGDDEGEAAATEAEAKGEK